MACVRKRRGVWICDYRDHLGIRRTPSFRTKAEAEAKLSEVLPISDRETPKVTPDITIASYVERWLAGLAVEESTRDQYRRTMRLYVVPAVGAVMVRQLRRSQVKTMLTDALAASDERKALSRDTVRLIHSNLRTMMNAARDDDELIRRNPCDGLGRLLRLARRKETRQQEVKAFDRGQLNHLLVTAIAKEQALYPLVLTMASTGMRPGEALALEWDDVDLVRQEIRIERAVSRGKIKRPKSGHGRTVHTWPLLGIALRDVLRSLSLRRGENTLVFPSEPGRGKKGGTLQDHHNVARRFRRLLQKAKLPAHHSIKCLRHTYASILLAEGESPAYVQEQLGHASITLTVDTYGRWLRKAPRATAPAAVAELPVANSANVVAGGGGLTTQVVDGIGDARRTRTFNPEIKSISRGFSPPPSSNDYQWLLTCEDVADGADIGE